MNNWLASFSKNTIALVAIVGGIFFIIMSDPPHTVCDSQIDIVKDSQKHFLYVDVPKTKVIKTTLYKSLMERCKAANNPGGCYELFQKTRDMIDNLTTLPAQCSSPGGDIPEVNTAMNEMTKLMVRLAWGEKPPSSYYSKFGWLDTADVSLFCKLSAEYKVLYGDSAFTRLREKMMAELPGAKDMQRKDIWEMSLFSENCQRYP